MGELYQRTGKLILGDTVIEFGPSDHLSVAFEVRKTMYAADPNTATVTVRNLATKTRSKIDQVYRSAQGRLAVGLEAGYRGQHGVIFKGETISARNYRTPTEWITEVQAITGRAVARKQISRTFAKDTELRTALESLVADTVGGVVKAAKETAASIRANRAVDATKALVRGLVLAGDPSRVWEKVGRDYDLDYVIDDEELIVLPRGAARDRPAIVLRGNTGLIGVPERIQDDRRPGVVLVSATSLLTPLASIWAPFQLESETLSGLFRIETLTHRGDTHGDEWVTQLEGPEVRR